MTIPTLSNPTGYHFIPIEISMGILFQLDVELSDSAASLGKFWREGGSVVTW